MSSTEKFNDKLAQLIEKSVDLNYEMKELVELESKYQKDVIDIYLAYLNFLKVSTKTCIKVNSDILENCDSTLKNAFNLVYKLTFEKIECIEEQLNEEKTNVEKSTQFDE